SRHEKEFTLVLGQGNQGRSGQPHVAHRRPARWPAADSAGRARVEAARIREQGTGGPEQRNLNERCITRSLPRLPDLYNNNYLIVQTPGYVVILMDDDPRCPPDSTRRPTAYPTDHSTVARRRARSLEGQHPH